MGLMVYVRKFIRKTKKKRIFIKSKKRTLEVFRKLEWYVTLLDKLSKISCSGYRVVEGYDKRRG